MNLIPLKRYHLFGSPAKAGIMIPRLLQNKVFPLFDPMGDHVLGFAGVSGIGAPLPVVIGKADFRACFFNMDHIAVGEAFLPIHQCVRVLFVFGRGNPPHVPGNLNLVFLQRFRFLLLAGSKQGEEHAKRKKQR